MKVPLHLRWMSRWVLLLAKGTLWNYSIILQSTNIFPFTFTPVPEYCNHQMLRLDCRVFLPTGRYLIFYVP